MTPEYKIPTLLLELSSSEDWGGDWESGDGGLEIALDEVRRVILRGLDGQLQKDPPSWPLSMQPIFLPR